MPTPHKVYPWLHCSGHPLPESCSPLLPSGTSSSRLSSLARVMGDTEQLVPSWAEQLGCCGTVWFHPSSLFSTFTTFTSDVRTFAFWTFFLFAGVEVEI